MFPGTFSQVFECNERTSQIKEMPPLSRKRTSSQTGASKSSGRRGPKRAYQPTRKFRVPRSLTTNQTGFPNLLRATLRYSDLKTLNDPGTGLDVVSLMFSANGLYDPDLISLGHQPMYFDQFMAIYNHYHVVKSRLVAKFICHGQTVASTHPDTGICGIFLDDDAVLSSSNQITMLEQAGGVHSTCTEGQPATSLSKSWSAAQKFGLTEKTLLAQDQLKGTSAANPTEGSTYRVWFKNSDNLLGLICNVVIQVEYDVIFTERKQGLQS